MMRRYFRRLSKRLPALVALLTMLAFQGASMSAAWAMNSVRGGALPQPLPLFPADNWWNLDISSWPVDTNSASYISFINNGGTRHLHPDFGGNDTSTANGIYGMPYVVVSGVSSTDLQSVQFQYWDESDGVNQSTGESFPFYPIPPEAITQARWIEGGDPGNVDRRSSQDRHLLIVDGDRNYLYELYNVFYSSIVGKWLAGSGAFFDMNTNNRRPDGGTSADAAGLAILPGLVRYDEVYDPTVTEIRHALRVTVRTTDGYVYPASHRAGSTTGALPMGARLRLKANIDVAQRTSDPNMQKIFRAMQKYGLIVADNGSDMYITGTYDTRWSNDILNPAFGNLTANDFEVVQLGYKSAPSAPASLNSLGLSPSAVTGGQSASGTVNLTGPAPAGGAVVTLASANPAATVPNSVMVAPNSSSVNFTVNTISVSATTAGNITATYSGVTKSAALTVNSAAPAVSSLSLNPTTVVGGSPSTGTVKLNKAAPAGGATIALTSNKTLAIVPASVTIAAGATSVTFTITTKTTNKKVVASIGVSYHSVTKSASLTVIRR